MSDWVMHFIHDRNPAYESFLQELPDDIDRSTVPMPVHIDPVIDARAQEFFAVEGYVDYLEGDAHASQVLMQIIKHGFVRSSWSIRGGKSGVYGPKAAVCFTEMPLSSLVEYANNRDQPGSVQPFAIGLLKSEFYRVGGRPVISGLSGRHREAPGSSVWPRFLQESCGLGMEEQYRYVAFNLGQGRPIDWTHEREWRWSDHQGQLRLPGLPIWRRSGEHPTFSRAIIVVPTDDETVQILNWLQLLADAGWDAYDRPYNTSIFRATAVVSLEEILRNKLLTSGSSLTLENIPHNLIHSLPIDEIGEAAKETARQIVAEALEAARHASTNYMKAHRDDGPAGFAELVIDDARSEFTRAAFAANLLSPMSGTDLYFSAGYWVKGVTDAFQFQGLDGLEIVAQAALDSIRKHHPDLQMHVYTRWD